MFTPKVGVQKISIWPTASKAQWAVLTQARFGLASLDLNLTWSMSQMCVCACVWNRVNMNQRGGSHIFNVTHVGPCEDLVWGRVDSVLFPLISYKWHQLWRKERTCFEFKIQSLHIKTEDQKHTTIYITDKAEHRGHSILNAHQTDCRSLTRTSAVHCSLETVFLTSLH